MQDFLDIEQNPIINGSFVTMMNDSTKKYVCKYATINQETKMYLFPQGHLDVTGDRTSLELTQDIIDKGMIKLVKTIIIRSSEELFLELQAISNGLNTLGAIIQNNMTIDYSLYEEWSKIVDNNIKDLTEWKVKVQKYLNI